MTYSKTHLDAETDQMIAYIADSRANPDAAPPAVTELAGEIAASMAAEFPGSPDLGRIVVVVSQIADAVTGAAREAGLPPAQALALAVNAMAFAGQELAQRAGEGS